MNILLENVDLQSSSGPNSFANKLVPSLKGLGCEFVQNQEDCEVSLCFIQSYEDIKKPRIQRLDGIYFNIEQNYQKLNQQIQKTFNNSTAVIYQSDFNKRLVERYFGSHKCSTVIHNGADLEQISKTTPMKNEKYDNIWCCASSWRPHKRLKQNIDYYLSHRGPRDIMIVAGHVPVTSRVNDPRVVYFGNLSQNQLYSLYKASKYFVHLAWLDHCPNVVVDARASGCHIVCSSAGGTVEIAGKNSTVIVEDQWNFEPTRLYNPPQLKFHRKIKNNINSCYDINVVAKAYKDFMEKNLQK